MLRKQLSWLHVIFDELDPERVMGLTAFVLELEVATGIKGGVVDAGTEVEITTDEV